MIQEPDNQGQPLYVVGLGVREQAILSPEACLALQEAEFVMGSKCQLKTVAHLPMGGVRKSLPALSDLEVWLNCNRRRKIVILASGDPLFYGIGHWLSERFSRDYLIFYPAVSSIQAACHQIGISLQNVEVISLHGRPIQRIRACLRRNRHYAILTDANSNPYALARECVDANFPCSRIWVGERLGYKEQRQRCFTAEELLAQEGEEGAPIFDPLHTTVLYTEGAGGVLPEFPGIPDTFFETGEQTGSGLLSKREVRLAALSLLQPGAQQIGWDVGAGCGGIAVEWARWNPTGQVYAIERHPQRAQYLSLNRDRFGVDANLFLVEDSAPECLGHLPDPHSVFIGGSGGKLGDLLSICWQRLLAGGCLVASAVTETSRTQLHQFADRLEASEFNGARMESMQIALSRGGKLAGQPLYRPQLPVTLMKFTKESCKD